MPDQESPPLRPRQKKQDEIYESLLRDIQGEQVPVGSYLPSTRDLARHFGSSLTPVNLALRRLEEQAYVETIHGSGVIVRASSSREAIIRKRPVVEVVTTLGGIAGGMEAPGHLPTHSLPAVQEWLLWHLHEHSGIRVRTCLVTGGNEEAKLRSILQEALVFRPKVLALPYPEGLSDEFVGYLRQLVKAGTRPVLRPMRREVSSFDRVHSDFRRGQRELTGHLLRRGCRSLVRLSSDAALFYEQQKQAGFEEALRETGATRGNVQSRTAVLPIDFVDEPGPVRVAAWKEEMARLLRKFPDLDGVMARTDLDAASIQLALAALGRPGVAVTGYDNDWLERGRELERLFGDDVVRLRRPATVDTCLPEFGKEMSDLVILRATDALPDDQIQVRVAPQKLVIPPAA